jgi:GNAT superfamily N-acetyltransferase
MVMDWTESRERRGQPADEDVARAMWQSTRNKQPPMQYWLAYEGERPIAYFASWQGHQGVGQVEDLFTHPDYRNRGIAKSLIFHCVEESRKAGADRVVITADPTDTPMHIYASLGFRPVAIATNYLKKPAD